MKLIKSSHVGVSVLFRSLNRIFDGLHLAVRIAPNDRWSGVMITTEQRSNLALLLGLVLDERLRGEVVELGCYDGQSAVVLGSVKAEKGSSSPLHVYDNFMSHYGIRSDPKERMQRRFSTHGLPEPMIHVGDFEETLSTELPDLISFAHVDCGIGDDPKEHAKRLTFCLDALYDRLVPGAVCALMDYHNAEFTTNGWDANPGVKLACDEFLRDKVEEIKPLYGGDFSHAFFRKR